MYGPVTKNHSIYSFPLNWELLIDTSKPGGNLCRYLCHSCEPNLGIRNRTEIVAFKDIKKDEEITIDYAMIAYEYPNDDPAGERICKCGSKVCKGVWGAYTELTEEEKERYKGYVADYLFEPQFNQ